MNFDEEIESIMNGERSLSYSALKAFLKSPKHFYEYKTDKVTTDAMEQGKLFHMACLEPDKFKEKYWVLDDSDKCAEIGGAKPKGTKVYKEWVDEQVALHQNQLMISKEDYCLYLKMSEYLTINSATKDLMKGLKFKEKSFSFEHDGFKISGKIDGEGAGYTLDLKKVSNAEFKRVKWSVKDDEYHMQGAIYCAASGMNNHYLIFIDNNCNVTVIKLSKETLEEGWSRFELALNKFSECAETNSWKNSFEFYNNGYIEI